MPEKFTASTPMEQAMLTWTGLIFFLDRIRNYLAVLDAIHDYSDKRLSNNEFICISRQALELQSILEIEQIFDKAHYKRCDNCSISLLIELCLDGNMRDCFPDGKNDVSILSLQGCCSEYERVLPIKIRNKQIAHHDFDTIFGGEKGSYVLAELQIQLIENTINAMLQIGKRLMPFDVEVSLHKVYKDVYTSSIQELCNMN